MMKVYIETYGCSSNQSDSEQMAGILAEQGHLLVDDEASADAIVLNTCTVKQVTENRIRSRLVSLRDSGKRLVIAGCMAEAVPARLRSLAPSASLLSTNRIHKIEEALAGGSFLGKLEQPKAALPKIRRNPVVDILEIESGCIDSCTFCATKLAKGAAFSYPPDLLEKQFSAALSEGVKEFWLTGQDVAAYRYHGARLHDLLDMLTSHEGNYFIRVGMMNPSSLLPVLNETIEAFRNPHVFKFLHLPVQSGSDPVLKAMNRRYSAGDFLFIVAEFRKAFPDITLWTDMICGFPSETDEDHFQSLSLLRKAKPDFVNVSQYGIRPDTPAAAMMQVPTEIKKAMTKEMSKLVEELSLQANKRWLNWSGKVLVDEYKHGKQNYIGRNHAYKPVVLEGRHELGSWAGVTVSSVRNTCLLSHPIRELPIISQ